MGFLIKNCRPSPDRSENPFLFLPWAVAKCKNKKD
jgi:hypothetical protein